MEFIIGFLIAIVASAITIVGTGWIANQMMGDPYRHYYDDAQKEKDRK